jgi:hypothetical protein
MIKGLQAGRPTGYFIRLGLNIESKNKLFPHVNLPKK